MNLLSRSGLMLEPQLGLSLRGMIDVALFAEKLGYGYVFRSDHFLSTDGKPTKESAECWTSLGALAASTKRVKFGTMVTPVGFRSPSLLAEMACTVHSYSGGRLQLGVGAGWFKDEYQAYGYKFPGYKERVAQLEEALRIIKPLTHGERVDFDGAYFTAHMECFPKPKGKIHLIVGGRNPKVVGLAAKYSDEWNIYSPTVEEFRERKKILDSESEGRSPEISRMNGFLVAETRSGLRKLVAAQMKSFGMTGDVDSTARKFSKRGSFVGVADDFVAQVNQAIEAGVDKFYFQVLDPGDRAQIRYLTRILKTRF